MSSSEKERTIHWLLPFPVNDGNKVLTSCGATFAEFTRGTLWVKELVTTNDKLVTCSRCSEAEGNARIMGRGESSRWRVEDGCILSDKGHLVAILPGGGKWALLAAAAPEMLEILRLVSVGDPTAEQRAREVLNSLEKDRSAL